MSRKIGLYGKQNAGCFWLVLSILTTPVAAQPSVTTLLLNGVSAPDGNGEFSSAGGPVLNDGGQLSFVASLINTTGGASSADRFGVFRRTGTNLVQVARGLETAPDGAQVFGSFFSDPPPMNSQGHVAFLASRDGSFDGAGLYTGTGAPLTVIADRTQTPPDGNGTFTDFDGAVINTLGQVAFVGGLTGTTPGDVNSGIYRGEGSTLDEIVRRQDAAPDGNGVFTGFHNPAINDAAGQVAFAADLSAVGASTGVFRSAGGELGELTQIARDGNPAPGFGGGINGRFDVLGSDVSLNDLGQVAFASTLSETSGGSVDNVGLFRGDSEFSNVMIASKGQAPPEGNGVFSAFSPPTINSFGAVAFRATLSGTSGGDVNNHGIYVGDGSSTTTVLRDGTLAPNGNGTFELQSSSPIINGTGQVAFEASFRNVSAGFGNGLYFWDPTAGLLEVARVGSSFLGSTITELRWAERAGAGDLAHSGLNSAAQMAYSFRLADNTEGLAIWSANLTVIPTGDYDGDGDVDGNDFLRWQRGQSPNSLGLLDLAVWQVRFGTNVPPEDLNIAPVPEPSAFLLLGMAGCLLGIRLRRCQTASI